MRTVKIILVQECYHDYDDSSSSMILRESISDWENISDEDYKILKDNFWRLQHGIYPGLRPVLIEQDTIAVSKRIDSIKGWIVKERERQEKEEADRKAKAAERTKKKMLKKAGDELKLLEELKAKYPEA